MNPTFPAQILLRNYRWLFPTTYQLGVLGISESTFVKYDGTYYTLASPETKHLKVVFCTIFYYLFLSVSASFQVCLCAF